MVDFSEFTREQQSSFHIVLSRILATTSLINIITLFPSILNDEPLLLFFTAQYNGSQPSLYHDEPLGTGFMCQAFTIGGWTLAVDPCQQRPMLVASRAIKLFIINHC